MVACSGCAKWWSSRFDIQRSVGTSQHKSREELETTLGDAGTGALIFERLGFSQYSDTRNIVQSTSAQANTES